jgi:ankyrin repeat protein
MSNIWRAAKRGDLDEVKRLLGHDPGLLNAKDRTKDATPLMWASWWGRVRMGRWLIAEGAATNENAFGYTALFLASQENHRRVVRLLMEGGADPNIAINEGATPLMAAARGGHFEVVRLLLGYPSAKATINLRTTALGWTALSSACWKGHVGIVTALLESGADPTIACDGFTPMAIAKMASNDVRVSLEGRRECVAALEVRFPISLSHFLSTYSCDALAEAFGCCLFVLGVVAGGGAGLPALEGTAGDRPAGERHSSVGWARGGGG